MNLLDKCKDKKIHNRRLDISTYEFDESHILLIGELNEKSLIPCYTTSGKQYDPETFHRMVIRILVDVSTLTIKEIEVELPCIPHPECKDVKESLSSFKGLRIEPGFSSKVKNKVGGRKGCIHLTGLFLAMAPALIQGHWVYNSREPGKSIFTPEEVEQYLIDSCWIWRRDSPHLETLLKEVVKDSKTINE